MNKGEGDGRHGAQTKYISEQIQLGRSKRELIAENPGMYRQINQLGILHPPRQHQTRCLFIHGPAGTGKTIAVTEALKALGKIYPEWQYFAKPAGGRKWFDGYDNQKIVLIDDPSLFNIQYNDDDVTAFKTLISSNPVQVEIKGGFAQFTSHLVIILSNSTVSEFVTSAGPFHGSAILDRISGQRAWKEGGIPVLYKDYARKALGPYVVNLVASYAQQHGLEPIDASRVISEIKPYKHTSGNLVGDWPTENLQRKRRGPTPSSEPKQRKTNY